MKIIITGSEGLLGKEISNHLEKNNEIIKLDLKLGHELSNEQFVSKFFSDIVIMVSLILASLFPPAIDSSMVRFLIFNLGVG